jgi:hypothetical protein
MAKNTKYESSLDKFLYSLKTDKEKKQAKALRATWWDKDPDKVNEDNAKTSEIARKRYLYY